MAPPRVPPAMTSRTYAASAADFPNPERGGSVFVDNRATKDSGVFDRIRNQGYTLADYHVSIGAYAGAPLSDIFLRDLESKLGLARQAGIKVILRFSYGNGSDAPLPIVLTHIGQLNPILKKNADVIAAMQAGFVGADGEWHSSTFALDGEEERAEILKRLLTALPSSRAVELRRPTFKSEFLGTEQPTPQIAGSKQKQAARLGHHNDCLAASDDDRGTYPSDAIDRWKDYIARDDNTPVGGETCPPLNRIRGCNSIEPELRRLRWSHLSVSREGNDGGVMATWRRQGCLPRIMANLGYRFVLNEASWTSDVRPGEILDVTLRIANAGYAAPYNERPCFLVLRNACGRAFIARLPADPRTWHPTSPLRRPTELAFRVRLPASIAPGRYRLSLWLPDAAPALQHDPRFAIRLANEGEGMWNAATGENILTEELEIAAGKPRPGGTKSSASFREAR